ncbi:MAG: hypothetical protein JWM18_4854, partial [Chloroflexi bacterium]|nr:hypothetical protein [Chloroflexota bacterium]
VSPRASSRPRLATTPLPPAQGWHHLLPWRTSTSRHSPMPRAHRAGGTQSPPSQNRRQSGPTRISTGGRTAGHLDGPAERPSISTGRRTPAHLHRPQNTPAHLHRPQNTPAHLHRPQCDRSAGRRPPATAVAPVSDSGEPGAGPRGRRTDRRGEPRPSARARPQGEVPPTRDVLPLSSRLARHCIRTAGQDPCGRLSDTRRSCRSRPRSAAGRARGRSPRPRRAAPPG